MPFNMRTFYAALACNLGYVAAYTEQALLDQVVDLPGADGLDIQFNQFSGYLQVESGGVKNMHYWFVESMHVDPVDAPVAFWTNGGPGCSGLLGFMTEMGPFQPTADLSLKMNEYAWNQVANMVYIESPAGVGFSYADEEDEDFRPDDASTADLNYALIQAFFRKFPEYQKNSLYLSSESYGGHYLPTLTKVIVDHNSEISAGTNLEASADILLNLKGFAVGNPYTTWHSGIPAQLETLWGHQLIPKPQWDAYQAQCVLSKRPNFVDCLKYAASMVSSIDLNVYALDYPVCVSDELAAKGRMQRYWQMDHMLANASQELRAAVGLKESKSEYEPCVDDYMYDYLNQASVKAAIHVKDDIEWVQCSHTIKYDMKDSFTSMTPIYNYLVDGGYNLDILVYSGDDDSQCSAVGTQSWIWDLGYEVGTMWETYTFKDQTAGYLTNWADTKLAFLTVHGAGHEVPTYKPDVALDMWVKYLQGKWTRT